MGSTNCWGRHIYIHRRRRRYYFYLNPNLTEKSSSILFLERYSKRNVNGGWSCFAPHLALLPFHLEGVFSFSLSKGFIESLLNLLAAAKRWARLRQSVSKGLLITASVGCGLDGWWSAQNLIDMEEDSKRTRNLRRSFGTYPDL